MAYHVSVYCDSCGRREGWKDYSVSKSRAAAVLRKDGWSIGQRGWLCPDCVKKKKGKPEK